MQLGLPNLFRKIRPGRWLLFSAVSSLVVVLLFATLVVAFPAIVSSQPGQNLIRQSLKKSLKREVTWSALHFSWSDGLALKELSLGPGQPSLLKARVADALVVPKVGYRDGRVQVDLSVRAAGVSAELAPGPPKPPAPYKEPLTALAEALQRLQSLDWPLPIDLRAKLAIDPVQVVYGDPKSGRKIELNRGGLQLEVPSLAQSPITVKLRGDLVLDGHRIEDLTFSGEVKRLVTRERRIRPAAAVLALDAALPGTSLAIQGGLMEPAGLAARTTVDLSRLMTAAAPFLPRSLPTPTGNLSLELRGKVDDPDNLHLDLGLTGSRLALSGGKLGRGLSPVDLRLNQKISSNLKKQQVTFSDGSLTVANWLSAAWQAVVDRPASRDRDLSARLGPVRADLTRLLAFAAPVLPPKLPVRELEGELTLREAKAQLQGRKDKGEAAVSGLSLKLPRLKLALSSGPLSVQGVSAEIPQLSVPLEAQQPTGAGAALAFAVQRATLPGGQPATVDGVQGNLQLSISDLDLKGKPHKGAAKGTATINYAVKRVAVSGAKPAVLDGIRGNLQLALKDLDLKSPSPRKVSAEAQLAQVLDVARVSLKGQLSAEALHEQLALQVVARKNGEIEVPAPKVELTARSLEATNSGNRFRAAPLAANLTASGVRLPAQKGAPPLLGRVALTLNGELGAVLAKGKQPAKGQQPADSRPPIDLDKTLERLPLTATISASGFQFPARKGNPMVVEKADCSFKGSVDLWQPAAGTTGTKGTAGAAGSAGAAAKGQGAPARRQTVPLSANLSAAGIRVPGGPGAAPSVRQAFCQVTGGDFLKLDATGALYGASPARASSDGKLRIDLDRALPLVAPALPKGVAAAGASSLSWKLTLPIGQKPAPAGKNPLSGAKSSLGLLDRADLTLTLDTKKISYPLTSGTLTLEELRTAQPLRLQLTEPGRTLRLQGQLSFTGLSGLSGSAGKVPAQNGMLTLNADLVNWQSLRLQEELKLEQFGLVQKVSAEVSGIDLLTEKQASLSVPALLQTLNAAVSSEIAAKFPATPTPLPGGAKVSGDLSAGVKLELASGRNLHLNASTRTRDFGVRLPNGTIVDGMRGEIFLERDYALAARSAQGWTPLSASLVRPAPIPFGAVGAPEIANRVREDLQGQEHGSRRFSIRRLVVPGAKAPVELTSLEGDLLFTPETVGLSFFQAELLGGTVRLRGLVDLKPEVPVLAADCSFTNLDSSLLAPPETRTLGRGQRRDTEITGELTLSGPLSTRDRELLEGLRMRLNLRKIGVDTLERALFSIDPYERNEQVVAQRKMLRMGTLKSLRAGTQDGAFSIEGEVRVKGVDLNLPRVERIRLSELAQPKQLAGAVAGVTAARKVLDLARSDTLVVGSKGDISLARRGHEK